MKFLIIDDAPDVVDAVCLCLELCYPDAAFLSTGYGETGLDLARREDPDLVILDMGLPDSDGFEICLQIHASSQVPIIMLTEQGYDMDAERGLAIGADDYMTKPFSHIEFLVKVQTVLRRAQIAHWSPNGIFRAGDLTVNYLTREVWVKGEKVRLTASQFRLLYHLTRSVGKVLTYQELLSKVWGQEFTGKTRRLIICIQRLRQKLGESASSHRLILTEHDVGYGLMAVTKKHSS